MAIAESSLSIALHEFANHLAMNMPQDVTVTTDTPKTAAAQAKGADKAALNVFCYRITPSGIHPDLTQNEPTFVRAQVLLTAFSDATANDVKDQDFRVLGRAIQVLQSQPVIPKVLPGGSPAPEVSAYRIQAVMQATEMEEMNHIWSIQGGDAAYRLSVVYELALIPIEPLSYLPPPNRVESVVLDLGANAVSDPEIGETPLAITAPGANANWLPFSMAKSGDALSSQIAVPDGTSDISLAIAGPEGEEVQIIVNWLRGDETVDAQTPQNATIASTRLNADTPTTQVTLEDAKSGDVATLVIRPSGADMPAGNSVQVNVT